MPITDDVKKKEQIFIFERLELANLQPFYFNIDLRSIIKVVEDLFSVSQQIDESFQFYCAQKEKNENE